MFIEQAFAHGTEASAGAFAAPTLSIPIITGLALLDSINPCVIGVLILLLTVLLKTGNKKAILLNGISYTAGVYLTYLIGGLTLLALFNSIREIVVLSKFLYLFIGTFVIIAGLLEVKDYFWYGRWFALAIPTRFTNYIHAKADNAHVSLAATFSFGAILTLIELPCTGAPYLAVLTLMSQSGLGYLTGLPLLLFYNLIFVLPLIVIIYLAYAGTSIEKLQHWKKDNKGKMRLSIGLALLAVGIWIITAVVDILPILVAWLLLIIAAMWFAKYILKK